MIILLPDPAQMCAESMLSTIESNTRDGLAAACATGKRSEVAVDLGITEASLSRYLRGRQRIPLDLAQRVADRECVPWSLWSQLDIEQARAMAGVLKILA